MPTKASRRYPWSTSRWRVSVAHASLLSTRTEAYAGPASPAITTTRTWPADRLERRVGHGAAVDRQPVDPAGEVDDRRVGVGAHVGGEDQHAVAGLERLRPRSPGSARRSRGRTARGRPGRARRAGARRAPDRGGWAGSRAPRSPGAPARASSGSTWVEPRETRETVAGETPANAATWRTVTRPLLTSETLRYVGRNRFLDHKQTDADVARAHRVGPGPAAHPTPDAEDIDVPARLRPRPPRPSVSSAAGCSSTASRGS